MPLNEFTMKKGLWPAYLNSRLWQVDLEGHFLPHENVWVTGFGEERLQDVQLRPCEGCALSALFPGSGCKAADTEGSLHAKRLTTLKRNLRAFTLLRGF